MITLVFFSITTTNSLHVNQNAKYFLDVKVTASLPLKVSLCFKESISVL